MIRKSISLYVPPISIQDAHHGEIVGDPHLNKYMFIVNFKSRTGNVKVECHINLS